MISGGAASEMLMAFVLVKSDVLDLYGPQIQTCSIC